MFGSKARAVTPTPGFSLTPAVSSVTLVVGYNVPINIAIADLNGFNGKVTLSASGVPSGVTAGFATVTSNTISVTFTRSSTAAAGTYPVTITGTSGTVTSHTIIVATILQPSFTLSSSASALTLLVGGASAGTTVTVTGQNTFSNSVGLAVSGLPSGVTATFSSPSTTTKSTLTFTATSTAVPGTYTVTVNGASGTLTGTTSVALTIPLPSFCISSSASSLNLLVGGVGASSTIRVAQTGGAVASIALTVTGLPTGVTATLSPATTTTASLLTLTPSSRAVPGSYVVNVLGVFGTTTNTSTKTIALTIPVPGFSLSPATNALSLLAGGASANRTIDVTGVNGFSSTVALKATGLPTGVIATFSPATPGTTSTLTFAASSSTVAGSYTVTVTGTSGTATSTAAITLTIPGPISIAITQPKYGFNVIPGSVRRIYATVTNGLTNAVNWSVTGGASLSSSTGNWVDVTAPATGSSCSINGTANYSVTSAKQFTLTAQSQENPKKTTSIAVNVCNPAVQVQVVPFYTTLYSEQKADIQAFVWGTVNHNVTWKITSEPNGGNGVLTDAVNQDTVFSASVAGRYTLTATSVADPTKTNTSTVYVTGHSMIYDVTPSETMPVDCTVDPALTGMTYNVGPSQTYKTISSVPWASLKAGSTVRIHNEDTTGGDPTTYHEYFLLTGHGTRTQPIRVCGVPDSRGNLPVIDASNSAASPSYPSNLVGYGAVTVGQGGWAGVYTGTWTGPQDLIVEGLKIQNAKPTYSYTTPSGATGTAWLRGSACVRLFQNMDAVVRGIDANNCGDGILSDFNANNGFAVVANTLYEGNHLHSNGIPGVDLDHQLYIQGWNEVVQFNIVDQYQSGAGGSNFKGRGFPEIVRYNHFGDGALRQLDMIDNQDAGPYTTFKGFLGGDSSYHSVYPKDTYSADLLAAAVEAHHGDYVYGNTFVNSTAEFPIHYFSDDGTPDNNRLGTLWFYSNSFYEPTNSFYRWSMFDTSGGGGGDLPAVEWPQIQSDNNAIWMDAPTEPYFCWNKETNEFTTFGKNAIDANWGTNNMNGGNGTGWATLTSKYAFQGAGNSADTAGVANLIGVSAEPFDVTTFAPNPALVNAGAPLPATGPKLPVRFQYGPSAVQRVREQPLTIGAME